MSRDVFPLPYHQPPPLFRQLAGSVCVCVYVLCLLLMRLVSLTSTKDKGMSYKSFLFLFFLSCSPAGCYVL